MAHVSRIMLIPYLPTQSIVRPRTRDTIPETVPTGRASSGIRVSVDITASLSRWGSRISNSKPEVFRTFYDLQSEAEKTGGFHRV